MWILFWKKYGASKMASFVSFLGAIARYAGVGFLCSSMITEGIVALAIGIATHFIAEAIAKSKAKKKIAAARQAAQPQPKPQPQPRPKTEPQPRPKTEPIVQKSEPTAPKAPSGNVAAARSAALRRPCPNCGTFVPGNSKFCNECGTQLIK